MSLTIWSSYLYIRLIINHLDFILGEAECVGILFEGDPGRDQGNAF